MTASKVYKMGGLYKKPFDRPQSYTVLASDYYAMAVRAPRLPPRSTKWADYIRNRLIGRKVTRFWLRITTLWRCTLHDCLQGLQNGRII